MHGFFVGRGGKVFLLCFIQRKYNSTKHATVLQAAYRGRAARASLSKAAPKKPPEPTLPEMEARARRLCAFSEDALKLDLGGHSRDKKLKAEKLPKACTCAALIVVLAREVYGLTNEHRIAVAADIHGFDGSWALGAMVYEIAEGTGQYGMAGVGVIIVAGALLVGLAVSGLRRAGWGCPLTNVRLY